LEHENISVQVSTRAGSSCQVGKKSWPVTGLGNRSPLKDLNDSKLILNEFKWLPWLSSINLVPFRTFRGPLYYKPVLVRYFFSTRYNKSALIATATFCEKITFQF
jgi:hypothetical protein